MNDLTIKETEIYLDILRAQGYALKQNTEKRFTHKTPSTTKPSEAFKRPKK